MRVFISSTSEDLKEYRKVVEQVVLDAQWVPVSMEHFANDPRPILQLCREEVDKCDLLILLQAFRRGWVPGSEKGGDGVTSVTGWEMKAADARIPKVPVLAFLADGDWPRRLSDLDPEAIRWVEWFRSDLNRVAKFFTWETGSLQQFRALVREQLALHRNRIAPPLDAVRAPTALEIRRIAPEPPDLPEEPYPLLGPYEHPATFAGRDAEIERLAQLVRQPPLILCVHAPSGAGKSSLLMAGLVPRLRRDGYVVSVERAPGDPGLARRLLTDVLALDPSAVPVEDDAGLSLRFAQLVTEANKLAGKPLVFVLDQIDDLLRNPQKRPQALARIGPLLASTAQRLPGNQGFACKWILCYRHEFHGEVRAWLADPLAEALAVGQEGLGLLPSDLSDPVKAHDWALPVFAKLSSDERDSQITHTAFLTAVVRPLEIQIGGRRKYPYVLSGDGAARLATVFGEFRRASPEAPLTSELQVVLNDLLRRARSRAIPGADAIPVEVPEGAELHDNIVDAIKDHVVRALNNAFPNVGGTTAGIQASTRALLALFYLTDGAGRRGEPVPEEELVRMIGPAGSSVLLKLAAADTRLIVIDSQRRCELSHDSLAEAVTHIVTHETTRRGLVIDQSLIDLQHIIERKVALFSTDETDRSALSLTSHQRDAIQKNHDLLISTEERRNWWTATERIHLQYRQRTFVIGALAAAALLVASIVGYQGYERSRRGALRAGLIEVLGNRKTDFAALVQLSHEHSYPWTEVRGPLDNAFIGSIDPEILATAPWLSPDVRSSDVLDVLERSYGVLVQSRALFGAMTYALEEVWLRSSSSPELRQRTETLFATIRAEFIKRQQQESNVFQQPPPGPQRDPLNEWVSLPGGQFTMGKYDNETVNLEIPRQVRVSRLSIQRHEVTNEEFRRFDPSYQFPPEWKTHPASAVSWYEAQGYAAWLGAALPTEAQWEYAARGTGPSAGRRYPWSNGDPAPGQLANLDTEPVDSHPSGRTPEGIDGLGDGPSEWCRDAFEPYGSSKEIDDPLGPVPHPDGFGRATARVLRGAQALLTDEHGSKYGASDRRAGDPNVRRGFRLVLSKVLR
jgi:formylglycine-generating enzyme required for sulfatase activity